MIERWWCSIGWACCVTINRWSLQFPSAASDPNEFTVFAYWRAAGWLLVMNIQFQFLLIDFYLSLGCVRYMRVYVYMWVCMSQWTIWTSEYVFHFGNRPGILMCKTLIELHLVNNATSTLSLCPFRQRRCHSALLTAIDFIVHWLDNLQRRLFDLNTQIHWIQLHWLVEWEMAWCCLFVDHKAIGHNRVHLLRAPTPTNSRTVNNKRDAHRSKLAKRRDGLFIHRRADSIRQ